MSCLGAKVESFAGLHVSAVWIEVRVPDSVYHFHDVVVLFCESGNEKFLLSLSIVEMVELIADSSGHSDEAWSGCGLELLDKVTDSISGVVGDALDVDGGKSVVCKYRAGSRRSLLERRGAECVSGDRVILDVVEAFSKLGPIAFCGELFFVGMIGEVPDGDAVPGPFSMLSCDPFVPVSFDIPGSVFDEGVGVRGCGLLAFAWELLDVRVLGIWLGGWFFSDGFLVNVSSSVFFGQAEDLREGRSDEFSDTFLGLPCDDPSFDLVVEGELGFGAPFEDDLREIISLVGSGVVVEPVVDGDVDVAGENVVSEVVWEELAKGEKSVIVGDGDGVAAHEGSEGLDALVGGREVGRHCEGFVEAVVLVVDVVERGRC
jgi:hypothetical protein